MGDKLEQFKAAFMTKRKAGKKLGERVTRTMTIVEDCRAIAETLPQEAQTSARQRLDDLENRVMEVASAGTKKPSKAWTDLGPLESEAGKLKATLLGINGKIDGKDTTKRFERAVQPTFEALDEVRAGTAEVGDERAAAELQGRIKAVRDTATQLFDAATAAGTPTVAHCEGMETCRQQAGDLMRDVRRAIGLPATAGSSRAASRAVVDDAKVVPVIKTQLESGATDQAGRTPLEDLRGRLEVFDNHFAADPTSDPAAGKRNDAMRLAAVAQVTCKSLAAEVNDPQLAPRLAKALINEFGGELSGALAKNANDDDDDADAKNSVALAQALVMDDPIKKLMTGKIDPSNAVERIRDMAEAGGEKPSTMLKLLRQQFEMQIGSTSRNEVLANKKQNDKDTKGNFKLEDLPGELSPNQFSGMVETTAVPTRFGLGKMDGMAGWSDDGTELKLKPAGKQLHEVKAGDTFGSLAQLYADDPAGWKAVADVNKAVRMPDGSVQKLEGLGQNGALPVGAMLTVPGKQSMLDLLAPYVAAWDDADEDEDGSEAGKTKTDASVAPSPGMDAFKETARGKVTPEDLRKAAANLRSPGGPDDPNYTPAPGIGQNHKVRAPLGDDDKSHGMSRRRYDKQSDERIEKKASDRQAKEQDALYGALSAKQYAHLRLLSRSDEEDMEGVLGKEGKPFDEAMTDKLRDRYGADRLDEKDARALIKQIEAYVATVPLTITFAADRLFSDPTKNEPKFGSKYASEVTFSRGQESLEDMIGRDTATGSKGKVGTTGGVKTGWEERGDNYMRWRKDKDDREGRHDELAYEDQQIFGAANPMFDQVKGGSDGNYGENFYGTAHFLLNDAVRNRVAFVVRAQGSNDKRPPVQRKNIGMLIYDMLSDARNAQFLDALLQNKSGGSKVISSALSWEVHLYGGFDLKKDVDTIYLPSDIDKKVKKRIEAFAKKNGVGCEGIGSKPDGLEVLAKMDPKQVELPAEEE